MLECFDWYACRTSDLRPLAKTTPTHQFSLSLDFDKEELNIYFLYFEPVEQRQTSISEHPVHRLT